MKNDSTFCCLYTRIYFLVKQLSRKTRFIDVPDVRTSSFIKESFKSYAILFSPYRCLPHHISQMQGNYGSLVM